MKQYRPNVERQKWLYSMMLSQRIMRRRQGKPETGNSDVLAGRKQIPDNSEPWLPGGVRSVADAIWISDQIKKMMIEWRLPRPPQS